MKNLLKESELTKTEVKKLVQDQLESELKKLEKVYLTKKDVKEMTTKELFEMADKASAAFDMILKGSR